MSLEKLKSALSVFDGISVSILSEAQVKYGQEKDFLLHIVELAIDADNRVSDGSTWILKAEIENGTQLPVNLIDQLVAYLDRIVSWQAVLHILQIAEKLKLTESQSEKMINWAKTFTRHKRPFLRAWSVHVIVSVGYRFNRFKHDSQCFLEAAEQDEAASVCARARFLRKTYWPES